MFFTFFSGQGLQPEIRNLVWPFLLGVYDWSSTSIERESVRSEKQNYYYRMKLQWKTISDDQQIRFNDFRERLALIGNFDRSMPKKVFQHIFSMQRKM